MHTQASTYINWWNLHKDCKIATVPISWFGCCTSYVRCHYWGRLREGHTGPCIFWRWGKFLGVCISKVKTSFKTPKILPFKYSDLWLLLNNSKIWWHWASRPTVGWGWAIAVPPYMGMALRFLSRNTKAKCQLLFIMVPAVLFLLEILLYQE